LEFGVEVVLKTPPKTKNGAEGYFKTDKTQDDLRFLFSLAAAGTFMSDVVLSPRVLQ
jgi:hypothetical protein